ncbi:hypothetical protein O1611_g5256 [Lasiodiplodia mahajangana]|uniref:Uncharacterized protein n=1 Tax=Lasiodiplodia mahajangana TaxID=1108764 RepID=A0ACC2JLI4_9PEZI|nr:hypothetical protein O1611_g5256 [Lasiodiplodia mahajangana]
MREPLGKAVLRRGFQGKVFSLVSLQNFIPYHIDMLTRGDRRTREDFRFIQKWYAGYLRLSIGKVREHMRKVKLHELRGFAVQLIARPLQNDDGKDYLDIEIWEQCSDSDSDDSMSEEEEEELSLADDRKMAETSSKAMEELESYLNRGEVACSPPSVVVPSDTQEAHIRQGYDDDGFYVGHSDGDGDAVMREGDSELPSPSPSLANELKDAVQSEMLPRPDSESNSSSSSEFCLDVSINPLRPLSEGLLNLLRETGGNPNVTRSGETIILTPEEFDDARHWWKKEVATLKRRELRSSQKRHNETWAETNLLDRWDSDNGQFYWQTEGLFLCRLTELVFKETFEQARKAYWAEVRLDKWQSKEHDDAYKKPPGSPLREQFT